MKIALCFWGITRSLKYCIQSIQTNILYELKRNKIEYTIFMHTYSIKSKTINFRTKEIYNNVNNNEYKLLNPDHILIDSQEEIKKNINLKKYRSYPDPWNTKYNSVDNFILAMYSKSKVTKLLKENFNDFKYVIYLRPDIKYIQKFNTMFFKNIDNNNIGIPNFCLHPLSKFNDRFAICNEYNYHIYGDIFDKILFISHKIPLHSETVIRIILNKYRINTVYINFKFIRIRQDGEMNTEDKIQCKFVLLCNNEYDKIIK